MGSEGDRDEWRDRISELVERALAQLFEHAEAVQICVTRTDDEGYTQTYWQGKGNLHARMGMLRSYLSRQVAQDEQEAVDQYQDGEDEDLGALDG